MAGSLNGVSGQQLPISNTFQPGGQSSQTREHEEVQVKEGVAKSKASETTSTKDNEEVSVKLKTSSSSHQETSEQKRGSIVDIIV